MVTGFAPPEPLQMLTNGFKSPRDLRPQLTENFNVVILKGLATKAVDRQQSMNQLKAAFEESKKAAETVVETEIEPEEDTLTVLNNTNKANELESEKSYNQIKSIFPSPKVIISVLIIALLNIFILTNSDIELINNTLHFYIWKLFHFQMYYNKQFTMLIGVRNLNSIVLFFGIVFQWLLTLTLVFNIKSTWKVIYDDKMTKLFRFFAKANIFFTLILSIALFVSLSTSSILGTTKYYMGSTLVYIGSVNVGIIGTLSLVCMLISGLAIFKLWQKR